MISNSAVLSLSVLLEYLPPYRHIILIYRHEDKANMIFNDTLDKLVQVNQLINHPLTDFYVCSKIMTSHRENANDDFVLFVRINDSDFKKEGES